MLTRLILMIIPLFIFWMIYPQITQEINNIDCIPQNLSDLFNMTQQQADTGTTESFGGGGSNHFGGYTGEVKHKDFVSSHAVIQTNSSLFNPNCVPITESESIKQLLSYAPWMLLFGWIFISWHVFKHFWYGWDEDV